MKNKVYVIEEKEKKQIYKWNYIEFGLGIFAYAIILIMANNLFKGFYIENFYWALLAGFIISTLNISIKPALIYLTLPLTISTLGIFYPIVNVIIIEISAFLLGSHFDIKGFWAAFFITIFISIFRLIFDRVLIKPFVGRMK